MKRRYKAGDWLRVPLGGERDALVVITRACRSRLFGYFFAYPAAQSPTQDELRAFTHAQALVSMLFGGAPIERGRWQMLATSLAFDEHAWPFPQFSSRGAFGQAWTRVTYDPQTLQIVQREPFDAAQAQALPDARFASAHEVEEALRARLTGAPAPGVQTICEIRSPLDPARLQAVEAGGCVQFSTALSAADIDALRAFIDAHPGVRVRVHGFRHGFDAAHLARLGALRDLTLDVHHLQHAGALSALRALRALRIGAAQTDLSFLNALPELATLELRGTRAPLAPIRRCAHLQTLVLENTQPFDFTDMASAATLHTLTLAHGEYDLAALHMLRELRALELRALDAMQLPPLEDLESLERLVVRDLHAIRDLAPIAGARSLRALEITGMPQLNVTDFAPLAACAQLQDVRIDVGSRRKEREIYRLLRSGNT